ncbi:ROP-interactive CRIB motif-containing protein 7 [Tasmannia lanceolata]|uniref:ROP-interactive CRIB motif-containing protein 7 n=1 Tax=Tasmannia lanceolata TaxID=3420 RepID=UPI004063DF9D
MSFPLSKISILFFFLSLSLISSQPNTLSSNEQESVYRVLDSINSAINWRSLFPDDLCLSAPHGIVCDYFPDDNYINPHIVELNFGYVSDYSSNPPCGPNSSFTPSLTSFPFLRKLFFYKCFTGKQITLPGYFRNLGSSLEELIFIENPSLVGSLNGRIGNFTRLRRLVLSGTGIFYSIPHSFGALPELEQLVMTRNRLSGGIPAGLGNLKKLKILDLSYNELEGEIPGNFGEISGLLKLDLGFNRLEGKIPNQLVGLKNLEFLDLSFNRFGNFGIPVFLAEMRNLKEVYLSGNELGGQIPEIWEKLGGILGIGMSGLGLVGNIPPSMGVFLRNLCYLRLDNNMLEGSLPKELGFLDSVKEMNLENNKLSGRIPFSDKFSAKVGGKLKLGGNPNLCVDSFKNDGGVLSDLRVCEKPVIPKAVFLSVGSSLRPKFFCFFFFFFHVGLLLLEVRN